MKRLTMARSERAMGEQVVVITGATSGIGRATALRFAEKGASVVLASRRGGALDELVRECSALGAQAAAVPTDVANNEEVRFLAAAAVERHGRIDVWVNDAAVAVFAPFLEVPLDDFRRVFDVNVMGYVYGARAALTAMKMQGKGVLINVASIVGEIPQPYMSSYSMSKAAVLALGVSLRQELALDGERSIKVSTILPPTVDTPFYGHAANYTGRRLMAMPPVYSPQQVARAIVRASRYPRNEVVVGTAGKIYVGLHNRTPGLIESSMALQVERLQVSPEERAPVTTGNLFETQPDSEATLEGGWNGGQKAMRRRVITLAVLLAGAGFGARQLLRGR